jgi:hypothetical protein
MKKNYFKLIVVLVFATNVIAQNVPSNIPTNGLVGWWPFNGNANDESGNNLNGKSSATLIADRNGKTNNAYRFDGKTAYIEILNSSKLDIGLNSFSFSMWVRRDKIQDYYSESILSKGENNFVVSYNVGRIGTPVPTYNGVGFDSYGKNYGVYNGILPTNKWCHVACVKTSNEYIYYIDNQKYVTKHNIDNEIQSDLNSILFFGKRNNDQYFNGDLDDIAIYNRELTELEVNQLSESCKKETATSSSFNSVVYTTNTPVNLSANPTGGTFNGDAITNNAFNPTKAKLGKNQVKYNFKNSIGCADSTNFTMILVDTLGNKCSTYDTLRIKAKLTTGIKAGQQTSMNVYPNPTSDVLIIEANDIQALGGYKYKIVDLQGKEIYNALATSAKTEISLKSIGAKGMYILHIVDEKGVSIENKKIVLE